MVLTTLAGGVAASIVGQRLERSALGDETLEARQVEVVVVEHEHVAG